MCPAANYSLKKITLLLFLLAAQFWGLAQVQEPLLKPTDTICSKVQLLTTVDTAQCAVWKTGDYALYVELKPLTDHFQRECAGLEQAIQDLPKDDTASLRRYQVYAARYVKACNQLKAARNGFDLRQLVVYIGPENGERNKGNSQDVEVYVRTALERGQVAAYYKGQRVFTLHKVIYSNVVMSYIRIFFEDARNCAFAYTGTINW